VLTEVVVPLGSILIIFGFIFGPRLIRAWADAFGPGSREAPSAVRAELDALRAEIASLKAERGTGLANGNLRQELADLRAAYLEKILALERRVRELEEERRDAALADQQRSAVDGMAGAGDAPSRVMEERNGG